jgi:hypothetical protein
MAFAGDFTPVLAKHSKSFSLVNCISVGVDHMQPKIQPTAIWATVCWNGAVRRFVPESARLFGKSDRFVKLRPGTQKTLLSDSFLPRLQHRRTRPLHTSIAPICGVFA